MSDDEQQLARKIQEGTRVETARIVPTAIIVGDDGRPCGDTDRLVFVVSPTQVRVVTGHAKLTARMVREVKQVVPAHVSVTCPADDLPPPPADDEDEVIDDDSTT